MPLRRLLSNAPRLVFLTIMAAGAVLITLSSLAYFNFAELPPFVIEKLPVRFETLWLTSLRIHVTAALLSFPLCILLMTRWLQRRAVLHRYIGRVAGIVILCALVPTGSILAFDAKGGTFVTAGFLLSGALIAWFMVKGVVAVRRKQLNVHRRAMMHVFAQMSVAVTSRALLFALDFTGMSPAVAYVIALWIPVLGSVLAAEWFSGSLGRLSNVFTMSLRGRTPARSLARAGR